MKSLEEIEKAILQLPPKARKQLVEDMPSLCPEAFSSGGWEAILRDSAPRPALTSLLDELDAEYPNHPERFLILKDQSLRDKK